MGHLNENWPLLMLNVVSTPLGLGIGLLIGLMMRRRERGQEQGWRPYVALLLGVVLVALLLVAFRGIRA